MTTLLNSEIVYDRTIREYAIFIAGELIGYAPSYFAAEQLRTAALAETEAALYPSPGRAAYELACAEMEEVMGVLR